MDMKRKLLLGCLIPLIIVVCLGWWGVRWYLRADAAPPRFETVMRGDVEVKVTETGIIEALKKVEVKSKVAGRVAKLHIKEGDRVQAGQLLAEIDPTEINSQVEQMRAQLDGARARLEQAKRSVLYQVDQTSASIRQSEEGLRSAESRLKVAQEDYRTVIKTSESEISQADASLQSAKDSLALMRDATHPQALVQVQSGYEEAKASEENSRRNLERQKRLKERGFVSQQVVDAAETELAAARARLDQAKKRLDLIEAQNRLELAGAENRVKEAQASYNRALANRSQIAIRKQEVETAQATVEQARSQLRAARSGKMQDSMRKDDVVAAQAAVVQIENQLREIEVRQRDTTLVAPMSGVVTKRYIEEGELITSGISTFSSGTPVLQIANLSRMRVKMTANEVDVHKIKMNQPVEINIDGVRGVVFKGHVSQVAPAAIGSEGGGQQAAAAGGVIRFAVEVEIDSADPRLRPGMSARCTIVIARRKDVIRLPNNCIEMKDGKAMVQILTQTQKEGKTVNNYTPREVKVGLRGDSHVEILEGLKENEKVKPGEFSGPKRQELDINMS
jgi:HlyD family secretion protein